MLRTRLAMAGSAHGQVAAVVGEAGVGKSRLIYEFARAQRLEGWRVLEGAGVSYGQAMSYLADGRPPQGILHDPRTGTTLAEIREKVTGKLLALDPALEPALPGVLGPARRASGRYRVADPRPVAAPPAHARRRAGGCCCGRRASNRCS